MSVEAKTKAQKSEVDWFEVDPWGRGFACAAEELSWMMRERGRPLGCDAFHGLPLHGMKTLCKGALMLRPSAFTPWRANSVGDVWRLAARETAYGFLGGRGELIGRMRSGMGLELSFMHMSKHAERRALLAGEEQKSAQLGWDDAKETVMRLIEGDLEGPEPWRPEDRRMALQVLGEMAGVYEKEGMAHGMDGIEPVALRTLIAQMEARMLKESIGDGAKKGPSPRV